MEASKVIFDLPSKPLRRIDCWNYWNIGLLSFKCTTLRLHHSTIVISPRRNRFVFFNGLNVLNDLNGLNFFKSCTHMSLLVFRPAL